MTITIYVTTEQAERNRANDGLASVYDALCGFLAVAEVTTPAQALDLFGREPGDAQDMLNCTGLADYIPTVTDLFPAMLQWCAEHPA